jgi:hypothetical protein
MRALNVMNKLVTILLLIPSLVFAGENCPLNGYWQSDEKQTLESVYGSANRTKKQIALFSNGIFVKLVVKIECGQFTSVLEGWRETSPYEIIKQGNNKLTISYIELPDDEVPTTKEIHLHGECYSVPIIGGQFREFMCKSNKETFNQALKDRP